MQVVQAGCAGHLALSQHQPEEFPSGQNQAVQRTIQSKVAKAITNVPLKCQVSPLNSKIKPYNSNFKVIEKRQVPTSYEYYGQID